MGCGAIWSGGRSNPVIMDRNVSAANNNRIAESDAKALTKGLHTSGREPDSISQWDNCDRPFTEPTHQKEFIASHSTKTIGWPLNFPNPDPIEPVWLQLSPTHSWSNIGFGHQTWRTFIREAVEKLRCTGTRGRFTISIRSMPGKRLLVVIGTKGSYIYMLNTIV